MFRNYIGKCLYEANISKKHSKIRKVPEKAQKNQVKLALIKFDFQSKKMEKHFVYVNFQRNEDLDQFVKSFQDVVNEMT